MLCFSSRSFATAVIAISCTSAASAQYQSAQPVPEKYAVGFNSITPAESKEHLTVLTSKEFGGRGSGQDGFFKAAKWYSEQLAKVGFQPAGTDGTWFQSVPLVRVRVAEETQLTMNSNKVDLKFGMSTYVGDAKCKGQVVFVNLADATADLGPAEQFNGKIVVYKATAGRRRFRRNPMPQALRNAKPAAMIRVTTNSLITDRVGRVPSIPTASPGVSITVEAADKLAASCRLADDFFSKDPEQNVVLTTAVDADCTINVVRETVDVPNVIGWYPGSDPELRHEHVGLGAHLDHLGMRGEEMYPGADDNGSGSTALLQIAKAIHTNPVKPKRSIFLIVFCGEELGLLGSRHYVDNATRPLKDMVCMLNIDMIGRNEEKPGQETEAENIDTIHLVGSKRISMDLHDLTLEANKHIGFTFEYDEEGVYTRSDHANFAKKGIPITFIFGGFHPDYHRPSDTVEKINFDKLVSGARLNYLCAMMAAEHGHFAKNEKSEN